jgi:hypothetical protein
MDNEPTLGPHGRPANARRKKNGQYASEPAKSNRVTSRGNSKTYTVARLTRDGAHILIGMLRRREISARKAAKKAGWGGPPRTHRAPPEAPAPLTPTTVNIKALIG